MSVSFKICFIALGLSLGFQVAASNQQSEDYHEEEEHPDIEARLEMMKGAKIYSCNLQSFSQQCREYPIPKDVEFKIPLLTEGCQSMPGGKFQLGECPGDNVAGRCNKILRNNHDSKSLIYDNVYYKNAASPWTWEEIERVCADLEGTAVKN